MTPRMLHQHESIKDHASRRMNARHLLDRQLRLQADNIRQPVREQMANLRMHRWNSTEHETTDRKQHSFEDARNLEDLGTEAVVLDHVFQQASTAHFFLAKTDA